MPIISKEELEEMYWGELGTELGAPTIAKILGCAKSTVYRYMKEYNIPRRPPTTEGTSECFTKDTREQISDMHSGKEISKNNIKLYSNNQTKSEFILDEKLGKKIFGLYFKGGISQAEIGEKFNLSKHLVNKIVKCNHWTTKNLKEKFDKDKYLSIVRENFKRKNN